MPVVQKAALIWGVGALVGVLISGGIVSAQVTGGGDAQQAAASDKKQRVPDQVNDPTANLTNFSCSQNAPLSIFQSFKPAAPTLVAIQLRLIAEVSYPPENWYVADTVRVRAGNPSGPVLGESRQLLPGPRAIGSDFLVDFPFVPALHLRPGNVYIIEWECAGPPAVAPLDVLTWVASQNNPYAAGQAFDQLGNAIANTDFSFKTFSVTPG